MVKVEISQGQVFCFEDVQYWVVKGERGCKVLRFTHVQRECVDQPKLGSRIWRWGMGRGMLPRKV